MGLIDIKWFLCINFLKSLSKNKESFLNPENKKKALNQVKRKIFYLKFKLKEKITDGTYKMKEIYDFQDEGNAHKREIFLVLL